MDTEPATPPETSSSAPPSGGAPIPQASPLTAIGRLDAFDVESDEWPQYEERMFCYFEANGITDEVRMRAIFFSTVGARTYKLLRSLVAPAKPRDKSFRDLQRALSDHYAPKPSVTVQRLRFNSRNRQPGESVSDYVSALRALSEFCEFKASTLEEMLRDRLVCGIDDERIQRSLLAEKELPFARALDLARAVETAGKNTEEIKASKGLGTTEGTENTPVVHKIQSQGHKSCYRCGWSGHAPKDCKFKETRCFVCKKIGNIGQACRAKGTAKGPSRPTPRKPVTPATTHQVESTEDDGVEDPLELQSIYPVSSTKEPPLTTTVVIDGRSLQMEIDTGAAVTVISTATYKMLWGPSPPPLRESATVLRAYGGRIIKVLGTVRVKVQGDHKAPLKQLDLHVVAGKGPSLLGRNWLCHIQVDWEALNLFSLTPLMSIEKLLVEYQEVFQDELGELKGIQVEFHTKPGATPRFHKARKVPYSMKEGVEEELFRLQNAGVISPIQFSEWATPIVPVVKSNGTIRICGDYKATVNPILEVDHYPLPDIDELLSQLAGGVSFSKLDLSRAYQQLLLNEKSQELTTINTHKGLFRYHRLPFGIASAPGIFQRLMEGLLRDLPGVVVYLDDILITGTSQSDHLGNLREVLRRLHEAGLRLQRAKCKFMQNSVVYLGHRIDREGLHPTEEKVRAIHDAPRP